MDHADHLKALRAERARFAEVLAGADLARPVRACPGWDAGDLGRHLGGIHRWAAEIVRTGRPGEEPDGPQDPGALHAWYVEAAHVLVEALEEVGPEAPCWTLAPPGVARFWRRRQAHEALLHRWDLEASQGATSPLDPDLCVDGIDEVVRVFFPRQVRLGRMVPLPVSLALEAGGRRWVLGGDGADAQPEPGAVLRGPPDLVLLTLWGRRTPVEPPLEVSGDGEVVARILAAGIVP